MMNLSRKLTSNLPDWFNPAFVKELRQTLHSKAFWITSLVIVLFEAFAWQQITKISAYNLSGLTSALLLVLSFLWQVGTVFILQPAISRWTEERHLDAVAPERTTTLSPWQILSGKIGCYMLIILWVMLLISPLVGYLLHRINNCPETPSPEMMGINTRGVIFTAIVTFVLILNLNVWSILTAMTVRIRRNATGGMGFFGWLVLVVGTLLMMSIKDWVALIFSQDVAVVGFWITLFFNCAVLAYGLLLLASLLKPDQSNRMFPARLGGYLLILLTAGFFTLLYKKGLLESKGLAVGLTLMLTTSYISFQSILAAMEPLYMPKRMALDAPKNFIGKIIWYACGSGSMCAWLHLLIPFAVICVLFFTRSFSIGVSVYLMATLIWVCYAIIYGAITALLRMAVPKLNGGVIYLLVGLLAVIIDIVLGICGCGEYAYSSPLIYFLQRYAALIVNPPPEVTSNYEAMSYMVKPIVSAAWCMIFLMLIAAGNSAVSRAKKLEEMQKK